MDPLTLFALAALAFVASYVQSVAGFAMGMMMMAVGGGFGLVPIAILAAVVSLLSLVNVIISVRQHLAAVHRPMMLLLIAGQVPAIVLGVWLLGELSAGAVGTLKLLLGLFIALASASLAVAPRVLQKLTAAPATVAYGALGGLAGGLFSSSGPVIGWYGYRQPLPFAVIRATLLAVFGLTTLVRTGVVGLRGELTDQVWMLAAVLLPVVIVGSAIGARWRPPFAEETLKRAIFGLLFLTGLWICGEALWAARA